MKKLLTLLSVVIFSVSLFVFADSTPFAEKSVSYEDDFETQTIAFANVNVLPMTGEGEVLENQTVLINGRRITKIRPTEEGDLDEGTYNAIIDGTGKYLMPGLAEMHGHVPPTNPGPNAPSYFNDKYVEHTLFLYVSAGITTVRGMLGYPDQLELKDKVNNGDMIGPNLYLAGPSFNGNSVSSPVQAKQKVQQQKEEGWDLLKVHPGLTRPEYDAMAETAHEVGIHFGGHVPEEVGIIHAIEMGQLTMDHIDGYVAYLDTFEESERSAKMEEIIKMTKRRGVWIVPTQALWATIIGAADFDVMKKYDELKYIPEAVKQNYFNFADNYKNSGYYSENPEVQAETRRVLLEKMNDAGVKILMGTDAPQLFSVPGFSIHRELPHMKEANMTNYEIIESGTKNVGEYFADWDDFGTIAAGQRADLILVNENPLADLVNIQNHAGVMVQGKWYPREMIDKKLAEIEGYYAD